MSTDQIHASDATVRHILSSTKTWAVVGCSPKPMRASHGVAAFLQARGFRVIPVRPGVDEILGEQCYPDLGSIPSDIHVDVVDVFRRSDRAGVHVDEAISIGAKAVWMQLGVVDIDAAKRGRAAGLDVVMDRCPKIEFPRLMDRG